jgi:hypothetical protein
MHLKIESQKWIQFIFIKILKKDRAPSSVCTKDPNKKNHWPQGFGELSELGNKQLFKLGKRLRERYVTTLGLVSGDYQAKEVLGKI